jgi:hypothetical protein
MKSFLSACAAVVILAIGSWFVLERFQESATKAYTTTGARI